jgi:hypothetical protein
MQLKPALLLLLLLRVMMARTSKFLGNKASCHKHSSSQHETHTNADEV